MEANYNAVLQVLSVNVINVLSYACLFADNNNDSKLLGRPMATASLSYDSTMQPTYATFLPSTVSLYSIAMQLSAYHIILKFSSFTPEVSL